MADIYEDLPREEAMARASRARELGWTVHFKFTCENCGQRCTLREPNTLYEYGECFVCGHKTKIRKAGFLLVRME